MHNVVNLHLKDLNDQQIILLVFSKGAKTRRQILETLLRGPKNCHQIAKELKLDWWTVQKHLKKLKEANLIKQVKLGRIIFYKSTYEGEKLLKNLNSYNECK